MSSARSLLKYLLDVNVLVALLEMDHAHHALVERWWAASGLDWGVCALTEVGFLRIVTNPRVGSHTLEGAAESLADLARRPGYRYWPVSETWTTLAAPFRERVFGHQQITDAILLGLAVKHDGVLVTMDKAIRSMAGQRFARHVLVLE